MSERGRESARDSETARNRERDRESQREREGSKLRDSARQCEIERAIEKARESGKDRKRKRSRESERGKAICLFECNCRNEMLMRLHSGARMMVSWCCSGLHLTELHPAVRHAGCGAAHQRLRLPDAGQGRVLVRRLPIGWSVAGHGTI